MPVISPTPSDDIYMVIKSLLASRANSTLAELLNDYDDKVGDNRLPRNFKDLRRLLQSIPEVECIQNDYGLEMWQVKRTSTSSKQKSEYKYMKKGKPCASSSRGGSQSSKKRSSISGTSSQGSSFVASQPKSKRQRFQYESQKQKPHRQQQYQHEMNHNLSQHHRIIDMDGYFQNYQLMGDDFMLSLAKIDLGYKMTKDLTSPALRIGYCISGLTIKALSRIVRSTAHIDSKVIVYIGSVDILSGKTLDSVILDYYELVSAFRERGIEPTLCTLAPFAEKNASYDTIVNGFNLWLKGRKWNVIDINSCFLDVNGHTIRSVYQKDPRNVTGCNVRHLLWNKLGRQRVLKCLKKFMLGSFNY